MTGGSGSLPARSPKMLPVWKEAVEITVDVRAECRQRGARTVAIRRRALHERHRPAGVGRQSLDRLEELVERARLVGDEEPGALELVVRDQPLQLGAVGHAIEDVGGAAIRFRPSGDDAALVAQRGELREVGGAVPQSACVVIPGTGEAHVEDHNPKYARLSRSSPSSSRPAPCSTSLPDSSTHARVARVSAWRTFCSTSSTVTPSALIVRTVSKIRPTSTGASPEVGASSLRIS